MPIGAYAKTLMKMVTGVMQIGFGRAIAAGIVAGGVATLVQLLLWQLASLAPLAMLLRDSRLAAAILLGREVLPPAAGFDWVVMAAASLLHLLLSAVYGVLLAPLALLRPLSLALAAGMLSGLLLFMVNMYGFTLLFPWFAASRDWITAGAHACFGISGVLACLWRPTVRHSG